MKDKYTLIQGDCLEEMRKMPTGSVNMVFTSPPYNDSGKTERDKKTNRHFKYLECEYKENYDKWLIECIDEMLRVAKRQVMINIQPILSNKADVYKIIGHYADIIDNILIWYKPNAQPQHYPHRIANFYEMVIILKGKEFDKLYINSNGYTNVIVKNINSNHNYSNIHRAIMSEDFSDEIIREFTLDNDIVLDPFNGLGTTGISCIKYRRKYIGIELNQKYYDISNERLHNEASQMNIFDYLD